MRKWLPLLIAAASLGCTKLSSSDTSSGSVADYTVQVLQDKMASAMLDVSGSNSGAGTYTYAASSLPAWALFNVNTGVVTGVPKSYSDTFDTRLTRYLNGANPEVLGTVRVSVHGNPFKDQQWHLRNTGQKGFAYYSGTAGADIQMGNVIAAGIDGTGVKIAISDTGVYAAHEGLSANMLAGQSRNYLNDYATVMTWIGDPTPPTGEPSNAHGTAVASLAAQTGWNGKGGRGVAPGASLAGFLYLAAQDHLALTGYTTAGLNDQFDGAFDIVNFSWGELQCEFTKQSASTLAKLQSGVLNQRATLGTLYVGSAGNSYYDSMGDCVFGSSAGYYGNANVSDLSTTPYTVMVGATSATGVASSYSTPGSNLWVSAPGGEYGLEGVFTGANAKYGKPAMIAADFPGCGVGLKTLSYGYSFFNRGNYGNQGCKYTSTMNGTSSAAPVASGAIALILQANPALTWRDVKHILATTSDKIDPSVNPAHHPNTTYDLSGHVYDQGWVTNAAGFHFMNYYGFGRINVAAAVSMAQSYSTNLGSQSNSNYVDASGVISVAVPDNSATGVTQTLTSAQTLVIEGVQLKISISGCMGDIGLELTSPAGTKSVLFNINSRMGNIAVTDQVFLTNAFYGENTVGNWNLKVIDGRSSCTATLTKWALNFIGR